MRERDQGGGQREKKRSKEGKREGKRDRYREGGPGLWAGPGVSRQMGECETGGTDARL